MNIEIPQVAKDLVVTLAPALPFLTAVGKDVTKKAQEKLGEVTWEKAQEIWKVLNYNIELHPPEKKFLLENATQTVAKKPESEDAKANLRLQLSDILEADKGLAQKLYELLQDETTDVKSKFNTEIKGNVQGFVQGDNAEVTMNFGNEKKE